jgi:hypothetical protein
MLFVRNLQDNIKSKSFEFKNDKGKLMVLASFNDREKWRTFGDFYKLAKE